MNRITKKLVKTIAITLIMFFISSCAATKVQTGSVQTVVSQQRINELQKDPVPGTHLQPWQETYYDYVRVPGAIDPKGLYYRPSHKMVYEIRPGKYQKVQYPEKICNSTSSCDVQLKANVAKDGAVKEQRVKR